MKSNNNNDYNYVPLKKFTHEGYQFNKGEYYPIDQDEYHIYLTDDNNKQHIINYEEFKELIGE